jgi:tetratricopeptide (TPR) repeat protein
MAKVKKDTRILRYKEIPRKIKSWLENKSATVRKVAKHPAARTVARFGGPAGVTFLAFLVISFFFLPKDKFQLAKERLIKNPNDFEAHLILAEEYLENNQIEEAEKELLLAQENYKSQTITDELASQVLGDESGLKWKALWQKKQTVKPEDLRELIKRWEEIVAEKPDYRDGYLQLAFLHYKLFENEKVKEYLEKALAIDPNFEVTRELEKLLQ